MPRSPSLVPSGSPEDDAQCAFDAEKLQALNSHVHLLRKSKKNESDEKK